MKHLFIAIILISCPQLKAESAPKDPTTGLSSNYIKMFDLSRRTFARPTARKAFSEAFKDLLRLTPEEQFSLGLKSPEVEMTESQFIYLLQHNELLWPDIESYLNGVPDGSSPGSPEIEKLKEELRAKLQAFTSNKSMMDRMKGLLSSTLPVVLAPGQDQGENQEGYSNLEFFVNHDMIFEDSTMEFLKQHFREDQILTFESTKAPGVKRFLVRPSDLQEKWIQFLSKAQKEIALNVFEFNLEKVAQILVEKAKAGLSVTVGIDDEAFKAGPPNPKNLKVYQMLQDGGVNVKLIDSKGLNHQKMVALDWSDPKLASILVSSGNLTTSCSGKDGDLEGHPKWNPKSVPNANHLITMNSPILAVLIHHQIQKLFAADRMVDFPLGGSYRIMKSKKSLSTNVNNNVVVSFSPKGGLGNINRDLISQALDNTVGPIRMLQFAFSSEVLAAEILKRMINEIDNGRRPDFELIGDRGFSFRPYSIGLKLSGYKVVTQKPKPGSLAADDAVDNSELILDAGRDGQGDGITSREKFTEAEWTAIVGHMDLSLEMERNAKLKACPDEATLQSCRVARSSRDEVSKFCPVSSILNSCLALKKLMTNLDGQIKGEARVKFLAQKLKVLRKHIFVAPPVYGDHHDVKEDGKEVPYGSKLHHKVLLAGTGRNAISIVGTSYNFSDNANKNNEQFLMFMGEDVGTFAQAMYKGLRTKVKCTVEKAFLRKCKAIPDDE